MESNETWVTQQINSMLLKAKNAAKQAMEMLRVGDTNRRVLPKQARLLASLREHAGYLQEHGSGEDWSWYAAIADKVEMYQLTLSKPVNSRDDFRETLKVELESEALRARRGAPAQ